MSSEASVFDLYPPLPRGDTLKLSVTCRRGDRTLIDVTGAQAYFTIKRFENDPAAALVSASVGSGISIPVGSDGVVKIVVDAATMFSLVEGIYYYDVVVVEVDGTRSTQARGRLPIKPHPRPN